MTAIRNIGDTPRHELYSPVGDLVLTNVKFTISTDGVLQSASLPPQFSLVAIDANSVRLVCPRGHLRVAWAHFSTNQENIKASVQSYSSINNEGDLRTSGTRSSLVIQFEGDPLVPGTVVSGYVAYGMHGSQTPDDIPFGVAQPLPELASRNLKNKTRSLVRQGLLQPIAWEAGAGGEVVETRAALGISVSNTGAGEYTVLLGARYPLITENWATPFFASDGRAAEVVFSNLGPLGPRLLVTFRDGFDMADGDLAGILLLGPVSKYQPNYGATSPQGVHTDLRSRHVANYSQFRIDCGIRNAVFIPLHLRYFAGVFSLENSNIPAGVKVLAGGTLAVVNIGRFAPGGVLAAATVAGTELDSIVQDPGAGTITFNLAAATADHIAITIMAVKEGGTGVR